MTEAIRHYADVDSYYNGSEGIWTVCGVPWSEQPTGVVTDCAECVRLRRERISEAQTQSHWR